MLLEIAIGDSYGASFEFASSTYIKKYNNAKKYAKHHSRDIKPGFYTDDTQMSLAITEMILNDIEFTPLNIADKFIEVYKRDPREGYGKIYGLLNNKNVNSGIAFLRRIKPYSDKNGSVMRSVPIGIVNDFNKLVEIASIQSTITHSHPDAILSSQIVSLISSWAIYFSEGEFDIFSIIKFIKHYASKDTYNFFINLLSEDVVYPVPVNAKMTTRAVIEVLKYSKTYKEVLLNSCSLGGDTDSVAAVAMGIFSNISDEKINKNSVLYKNLENDAYGKEYLIKLDNEILKFVKRNKNV